jgi:hypothetical protein
LQERHYRSRTLSRKAADTRETAKKVAERGVWCPIEMGGSAAPAVADDLDDVVALLQAESRIVLLHTVSPVAADRSALTSEIERLNGLLASRCSASAGCLDLRTAVSGADGPLPDVLLEDGFHLSGRVRVGGGAEGEPSRVCRRMKAR